ncbi:MAG: hypothetical protein M3O41_04665 [Pseudomonadota bacterium]|nr:hypothetical protein [Pseudomonadota bacterium]
MRLISIVSILLASTGICRAGDLSVNVLVSGQVAPGVYGRVQLGNERPPPLVYAQPMLVEAIPAPPPPIYLHVPPGHAKHWRKHCREYNACNRPVYFIRSEEYEPGFDRRNYEREHAHDDRGGWREGDRERGDGERRHGGDEHEGEGEHERHDNR